MRLYANPTQLLFNILQGFLPVQLIEGRIANDLRENLLAIRRHVEALAIQAAATATLVSPSASSGSSSSSGSSDASLSVPSLQLQDSGEDANDKKNSNSSSERQENIQAAVAPVEESTAQIVSDDENAYLVLTDENRSLKKRLAELQEDLKGVMNTLGEIESITGQMSS
jgi:hypothetical protein